MDDTQWAMENANNPNQDTYKRVLCVCSAGMLRSPSAALLLSQPPYNYNTRACGTEPYAMIPISPVLIEWADEIVCMDADHYSRLKSHGHFKSRPKPVKVLGVPDRYKYRDPKLLEIIKEKYDATPLQ